ncbi:Alpha/Beta hydrolase protein [Mycena belliarum]|uniref:Alpha/Beta hydrolase protein n=1 Tax=Mycena belliarum TaxID=1033014 RepID=A0AAD6UD39_9AGAR|nr:Alpha/Beta hydrolase protein [Mycena belliae]
MSTVLDIPYSTASPLLQFDVYTPESAPPRSPVLVFVRGGAWRADDKSAHRDFATTLVAATNCPVLVPNYRLTTDTNDFRHPAHAEDVLAFLVFLSTWPGVPGVLQPAARPWYLMGHSAGAHILTSIFLDASAIYPSLTPPASVVQAVRGIVMTEGIYDIDMCLARFPAYRDWFLAAAFGDRPSYADCATTRLPKRDGSALSWLVVHSKGDTLVDMPQSDAIYTHLCAIYGDATVARKFDQLDVEHDDVMHSPLFIDMVRSFVDRLQS